MTTKCVHAHGNTKPVPCSKQKGNDMLTQADFENKALQIADDIFPFDEPPSHGNITALAAQLYQILAAHNAGAQEPIGEWRCFHCDEVFADEAPAAEHFGTSQHQEPACQIDITKYREMEETVRRYNEEDTDLHREIHRLHASHQRELQREEEKGYARGLADAVKYPSDAHPQPMTDAAREVLAERKRQVEVEGWTTAHDDGANDVAAMADAAACYAMHAGQMLAGAYSTPCLQPHSLWPWDASWWKPTTPRRDLVKAGALILAEIERIDRIAEIERLDRESGK